MSFLERDLQVAYLSPNPYSRPRRPLRKVKGIALHWTGNPGTSAVYNREYFELRKNGKFGYGSAHFIIGLAGEVVQCIPLHEMAYHVGAKEYTPYAREKFGSYPNNCTLGIEMCHINWVGEYTPATWDSAVDLCAGLCDHFELEPLEDLTTHYEVTQKVTAMGPCPKWFTEHPKDWKQFKQDVHKRLVGRSV